MRQPRPGAASVAAIVVVLMTARVAAGPERVAVTLIPHTGSPVVITAELAATPRARQQGLMWRRELAAGTGMLFDFGAPQPVAMWMQETYVALDMLFIADDGRIVDIRADRRPLSTMLEESASAVRYVLEINAGEAARGGLRPGDTASLRALP
ncbi:MAG: DUF192 domain-containing protein [Gammaproteobacteria bacterium]|nr:DUF192 domain-containing protein [Gammaproteobacteria bacterium]